MLGFGLGIKFNSSFRFRGVCSSRFFVFGRYGKEWVIFKGKGYKGVLLKLNLLFVILIYFG